MLVLKVLFCCITAPICAAFHNINTHQQQFNHRNRLLLPLLPNNKQIVNNNNRNLLYLNIKDIEYNLNEIHDVETLIITLANEQNDQIRRDKVQEIFTIELSKQYPQHFTNLFNAVLIDIGDKVRQEALQELEKRNNNNNQSTNNNISNDDIPTKENEDDNTVDGSDFLTKRRQESISTTVPLNNNTSGQQGQVWALIDMMVQSKTIIKKSNGQLGREGTFG